MWIRRARVDWLPPRAEAKTERSPSLRKVTEANASLTLFGFVGATWQCLALAVQGLGRRKCAY